MFKKDSCKLANAYLNPSCTDEYITLLQNKKIKSQKNSRIAANESLKANRRVKDCFYNTVNLTMNNPEISAKKKFSILTKLLNNKKYSVIPPLIENGKTISECKPKSDIFNHHFASKSSVTNSHDHVPPLPKKTQMFHLLIQLTHHQWKYPR